MQRKSAVDGEALLSPSGDEKLNLIMEFAGINSTEDFKRGLNKFIDLFSVCGY